MTKLASAMKFIFVSDRTPGGSSTCARCGTPIATGYLRDLHSRLPYCDHACYLERKVEASLTISRIGAGIDGLPVRGLAGISNFQGTLLGMM
jgi:hypothetical protein